MSSSSPEFNKTMLQPGDQTTYPRAGDTVSMIYTGWLYDTSKPNNRGTQFDSSIGRGPFKAKIGVGHVIQGWDEGVPTMSVGEKAVLTIPGEMAYGDRGFPGLIPPGTALVFEVELAGVGRGRG
ncbi:hypothetical protein PMZ80_002548 [Knufia obscura]|uniref:peptidylprolyl isomerase n=1 Tax=Knufia obscura TaxID=1635080 RepID=A0ABR0RXM5_9EURO|nr:hypothetical protein PMZ80_002548 [Knufia obscura]